MFICPSHASQILALSAFDCKDELDHHLAVYAANRILLMDGLVAAGLSKYAPPDGAFYIYVDVSDYTDDSRAFAAEILDQVDVAVTPGLDFDPVNGHKWLRLSYAGATTDIVQGVVRLQAFMKGRI